jgi:hypothetical protein
MRFAWRCQDCSTSCPGRAEAASIRPTAAMPAAAILGALLIPNSVAPRETATTEETEVAQEAAVNPDREVADCSASRGSDHADNLDGTV